MEFGFNLHNELERYVRQRKDFPTIPSVRPLESMYPIETIDVELGGFDIPIPQVYPDWIQWIDDQTPTKFVITGFDSVGKPIIAFAQEIVTHFDGTSHRSCVPVALLRKELEIKINRLWLYIQNQKLRQGLVSHTLLFEPWLKPDVLKNEKKKLNKINEIIDQASLLLGKMEERLVEIVE